MVKLVNPDVVFHLAEETRADWDIAEHSAHDNVTSTIIVLQACTANGIRCVIPTWEENVTPVIQSPWHFSAAYRYQLIGLYNRGNAINNAVHLPRIIMDNAADASFGTLVNRVYNAIHLGIPFIVFDGELGYNGSTNTLLSWCKPEDAVHTIIESAKRKTRRDDTFIFQRNISAFSLQDLIVHMCKRYDAEAPPILTTERGGAHKLEKQPYIYPQTKKRFNLVDEVCNVWDTRE